MESPTTAVTTQARSAAELLTRNAVWRGEADAVVTPLARISHADLEYRSRRLARRLFDEGVTFGTRVSLFAENSVEWVVVATAVMRLGAVLVPSSTLLRPVELEAQLSVADVEVVLTGREFRNRDLLEVASDGASALETVRSVRSLADVLGDPLGEVVGGDTAPDVPPASIDGESELVVLFTSGSRGHPKGVVHSHRSAFAAVTSGLDSRCIQADDRIYIPMPLFWTGGFSVGLYTMLVAGCALLTEAQPEPLSTLAMLERERATLFRGWPDQAARLAAHPEASRFDLSALRPASLPELGPPERRAEPGARPSVLGMTETFGPYCADRLDRDLPRFAWGSNGRPLPGIELRIVDPQQGNQLDAGATGEILLRGPALLRGICGREPSEVFDADGWFHTGDLAHLDAQGYVFFDGRVDDMVKVSGASVYPSEVESALRSLDGVIEAHVTDVAGERGPQVAALVVSTRSSDELDAQLRRVLSPFKVPTVWMVCSDVAAVPRGATGKVDLAGLRALLDNEAHVGASRRPDRKAL